MEPNQNIQSSNNMMAQDMAGGMSQMPAPAKKSNGMIFGLVFCMLLAIGGIGFGVYGMMQSSKKDDKISDLKVQIKDNDGNTTVIETPEIETTKDGGTTITIADSAVKDEDSEDYIYVGEWGVKIKIPENLQIASYNIENYDDESVAGTSLCVSGFTKSSGNKKPSFVEDEYNRALTMGCLSSYSRVEDDAVIFGVGEGKNIVIGDYYFQGPQSMLGDGTDADWETESVQAIKDMLSVENMSSI